MECIPAIFRREDRTAPTTVSSPRLARRRDLATLIRQRDPRALRRELARPRGVGLPTCLRSRSPDRSGRWGHRPNTQCAGQRASAPPSVRAAACPPAVPIHTESRCKECSHVRHRSDPPAGNADQPAFSPGVGRTVPAAAGRVQQAEQHDGSAAREETPCTRAGGNSACCRATLRVRQRGRDGGLDGLLPVPCAAERAQRRRTVLPATIRRLPAPTSAACLRAMQNAIYSLFRVDATEPGVALAVTDLATDEQFLLVDIGLSQTAKPGILFLSRLLLFDDFAATGGAAIPLGQLSARGTGCVQRQWKQVSASREPRTTTRPADPRLPATGSDRPDALSGSAEFSGAPPQMLRVPASSGRRSSSIPARPTPPAVVPAAAARCSRTAA